MLNRLGAAMPQGMIFALDQDVVALPGKTKGPGNVMLRSDKRPRPMVLRVNQGDCLQVTFTNLLASPLATPPQTLNQLQPVTRQASVHVNGMQLVSGTTQTGATSGIAADGSFSGNNDSSLVDPGKTATYTLYAGEEGTYLLFSGGSGFGTNGGTAGQLTAGLFGAVNVEPQNAEYYRSQVTAEELTLATYNANRLPAGATLSAGACTSASPCTFTVSGKPPVKVIKTATGSLNTLDGHAVINYDAVYPSSHKYGCQPILKMVDKPQRPSPGIGVCGYVTGSSPQTFYTDLTAIITGPDHGRFPQNFPPVAASPDRKQPFREFTIHYHEMTDATQAFTDFYPPSSKSGTDLSEMLAPGKDNFAINYGTGGIGAEILANRFKVGPMANCVECKFEEFFLSAWSVGDPAMVVDVPANVPPPPPYASPPPNIASDMVSNMEAYEVSKEGGPAQPPPIAPPNNTSNPIVKATTAYYADDPSNVYHSYLDDHVVFRILHAGANLTHVHHQHAHQWLHSPNDDNSTYLDSQMLSPGAAFTLEIDYDGGGNRNKTVGDSIFHCHFYPHFAAGMWSLWRTHDVFESGSELLNGKPVAGTRALPDGEISAGTPIPAIVPLPTLAMAPLPEAKAEIVDGQIKITGAGNPGFPFFIPGLAGHRAPAPPLDFAWETDANGNKVYLDGGLARNIITGGTTCSNGAPTCAPVSDTERHNQWDFTKNNPSLSAKQLSEEGEPVEKAAMAFHAKRTHLTFTPDGLQTLWNGKPANFITNGLAPQPGAPFADPAPYCPNPQDCDGGPANPKVRRYKAADVQMNVTFNKKGWHYPQQRFITLWSDVKDTLNGTRAPEPFFFRANSHDIIEFWLTNLVPSYYELDDFQVRTPTDIIGQHIHLVKFDVTSSDGATNGWNYEDGTLSAEEVRDRIAAIRKGNNCLASDPVSFRCPQPVSPPANRFGPDPWGKNWAGAQTTIQRWYADPLLNIAGEDRTLRTVFTHDHFGPSTHQQAGLYAGLVVEPQNSKWLMNDSDAQLGVNDDGGPTSWQARIVTPAAADSYREFLLEFQDLALAYQKESPQTPKPYPGSVPGQTAPIVITSTTQPWGWADKNNAIYATTGTLRTNPTIITGAVSSGTMSVNYRNEPMPFRVYDPSGAAHSPVAKETDLSYVFSSQFARKDPALNCQPSGPLSQTAPCPTGTSSPSLPAFVYPGGFTGATDFDPYTPLLRAYQNDKVQVRVLVGGYLQNHNFSMHGLKWLFEPSAANSGYRDNQAMGISEHFEFLFTLPSTSDPVATPGPADQPFTADYVYMPGSGVNDLVNGLWGLMRTYNTRGMSANLLSNLKPLPNNSVGGIRLKGGAWTCPANANMTPPQYVAAINSLGGPPPLAVNYNSRSSIANPTAIVYVAADSAGNPLSKTSPTEPLVLRANAGDCITVKLFNKFTNTTQASSIFMTPDGNANQGIAFPVKFPITKTSKAISLYPSARVGLRPQLLTYDVTQSNGANVGLNPDQTIGPLGPSGIVPPPRTYQWYAGNIVYDASGNATGIPIEFGSTNLMPSDPLEQLPFSLIAGLVVEPQNATWTRVNGSNTTVDVKEKGSNKFLFREFVAIAQENVYLSDNNSNQFFNAVNFGAEPMTPDRFPALSNWNGWDALQLGCAFSSKAGTSARCSLSSVMGNPQTPIFSAVAGTPVRFRMLHPDGLGGFPDDVWTLHGHVWQEEPYVSFFSPTQGVVASANLGWNRFSQSMGARDGWGPGNHFDVLINSAGGINKVFGDYLYKSFPSSEVSGGVWGIFRVCDPSLNPALCVSSARLGARRVAATRLSLAARQSAVPATDKAHDPGERFNLRRQARKIKKAAQSQP
jgi:hypothetical protein